MRRVRLRILAIFLIFSLCFGGIRTEAFAASVSIVGTGSTGSASDSWDRIITQTVQWMKGGHDRVLSENFLQGVSSTGTDWYVFSLGRLGIADDYEAFLQAADRNVRERYEKKPETGLSSGAATEWHRLTMAVLAAGGDPTSVGGQDLIADGVYNCKVGVPWKQGINGAIWALLAVDSEGYEIPEGAAYNRNDLIEYILSKELSGGGWNLMGTAFDPDITAMAVQALAPYMAGRTNVREAVQRALNLLKSTIQADGSVLGYGAPNCESTAQVIVAFASVGIDPSTVRRTSDSGSLTDGLKIFFNSSTGGFYHRLGIGESNAMATGQALYAIAACRMFAFGRNLYDFRAASKSEAYQAICDDGSAVRTSKAKNASILIAPEVTELKITNIPMDNYDAASVEVNGKLYKAEVRRHDGSHPLDAVITMPLSQNRMTLTITITDRSGKVTERTLKILRDSSADVKAVAEQIDALPDAEALTAADEAAVREAREAYDRLSAAERSQVTNLDRLKTAEDRMEALLAQEAEEQSRRRIALKSRTEALERPAHLSMEDEIRSCLEELDSLGEWEGAEELKGILEQCLAEIADRKKMAETLDRDIWEQIDPLRIDQDDESAVKSLAERYAALDDEEKKLVTNSDSLLNAEEVVDALAGGMIPAAVFRNLMTTGESFTYHGTVGDSIPYTVTYEGSSVQSAVDVDVRLIRSAADSKVKNSVAVLKIAEEGSLNGKACWVIGDAAVGQNGCLNVKNGTYQLYWYNTSKDTEQTAGTVKVTDGVLTMTVTMGGRYDLVSGSSSNQGSSQGSKGSSGGTTKKVSNLLTAETDGVFAGDELLEISGEDKILQTSVILADGTAMTISINGEDVTDTAEFAFVIAADCANAEDIRALAEEPTLLCLENTGRFPGTILITIPRKSDEEKVMLFRYDAGTRSAEYVKLVTMDGDDMKFTLSENGDYFLASRCRKGSLNDAEETEVSEEEFFETGEMTEEVYGVAADGDESPEEKAAAESGRKNPLSTILAIFAAGIVLLMGTAVLLRRRKKEKKHE